ncbi:MAG: hypothetical protein K5931_09635 [Lachnospiraceae bacterium]|nr:hypothetical protein [Lachnospiraceae bacterium]
MFKDYFSDKIINNGRQLEVDMVKAYAVIFMILEHTLIYLGDSESIALEICGYLDVIIGAAAFMICMGMTFNYTKHNDYRSILLRGVELLTLGQLLNIFRNGLPSLIFYFLSGKKILLSNVLLVLQADIYSFAGVAMIFFAILIYFKVSPLGILVIGFIMNAVNYMIFLSGFNPENYLVSQFLGYFVTTRSESYFSLAAYFVFVAFGYWFGGYYLKIKDKDGFFNRFLMIFLPIYVVYYIIRVFCKVPFLDPISADSSYIVSFGPDAIANCISFILVMGIFYKISKICSKKVEGLITHISVHIAEYYCISYIIIYPIYLYLLAFKDDFAAPAGVAFIFGIGVLFLSYYIIQLNSKKYNIHFYKLKGRKKAYIYGVIWLTTFILVAYSYPQLNEYVNTWNDYLE